GSPPFRGPEYDTLAKKLRAHAEVPAPPVHNRRPDVPVELAAVLERLLAKDPGARFAVPAEAARAVAPFAAGCNLSALLDKARGQNSQGEAAHSPEARTVSAAPSATAVAGMIGPIPGGPATRRGRRRFVRRAVLAAVACVL